MEPVLVGSQELKDITTVIRSILAMDIKEITPLSHAETLLKAHLDQSFGPSRSDRIFAAFYPGYEIALLKADMKDSSVLINIEQLRIFLQSLYLYSIMIDSFRTICTDLNLFKLEQGIGRLDFLKRFNAVQGYGLVGLDQIRDQNEANVVFDIMYRADRKDQVFLHDWISYLEKAETSLKTQFSKVLMQKYIKPDHSAAATSVLITRDTPLNISSPSKPLLETSSIHTEITQKGSVASLMKSISSYSLKIQANFTIGAPSSRALKRFASVFEPYTEKTLPGQKLRLQGFQVADQRGTGYCSLEDLQVFILKILGKKFPSDESYALYTTFRPSYRRAFTYAKAMDSTQDTDMISIASFRLFNVCLVLYAAIYDALRLLKTGGAVSDDWVEEDTPLEKPSFVKNFKKVLGCGFVGLDNIADEDAANAVFDLMKKSTEDVVPFDEWVDYIEKTEVMMKTQLGQFFSQKLLPIQSDTSVVMTVTTKKIPISTSKHATLPPLEIPSIFIVGLAASSNLRDFVDTFKVYTEKTVEGQKLRMKEFKIVDQNGSGRCSLSDLETFIKRLLGQRFNSSRAYYLCDLFRPSFARAYVKAKAFSYAKDYVSFVEFRVFSVYVCVYASMFDVFSRIVESDVIKNVEFEEKMERFQGYEFIALKQMQEKKQAQDLFHIMDRFARGFVDFDDWCFCLEKAEMLHKTKLGVFLSMSLDPRNAKVAKEIDICRKIKH